MSDYDKKRKQWLVRIIGKEKDPKVQLIAVKQLRKLEAGAS